MLQDAGFLFGKRSLNEVKCLSLLNGLWELFFLGALARVAAK